MDTISIDSRKARKDHLCDYCGLFIPKGEVYESAFINEGSFVYRFKNHLDCGKLASMLDMFDGPCDEGLTAESFHECIKDTFHDLWRKKDEDYYESKDFVIPDFAGQLEFVKKETFSRHKNLSS